jgi:hypothetical protein
VISDTLEANFSVLTLSLTMLASGEMCMNIITWGCGSAGGGQQGQLTSNRRLA